MSFLNKLRQVRDLKRIEKLEDRVGYLQALVKDNILALTENTRVYKGNEYDNYSTAIDEIDSKYSGTAEWGVLQTGNIIDLRAAFIISEGPKIVKRNADKEDPEDGQKELDWAKAFFEYNDLDREVGQEYAKEAEIEGKIAIKLAPETETLPDGKKETNITARFISWQEKKYEVTTDPQDYLWYQTLEWKPTEKSKAETLKETEFVYKKFGGRINRPNEAAPKIMKCLTEIEHLDKALRDWREINRIFAGPILFIKCKDKEEAKLANDALDHKNFKIKKAFVASVEDVRYVTRDMTGEAALEKEIIMLAKMISGTTGIPISFLGFADLMSVSGSMSTSVMEMVNATTSKERQVWKGAYEEMLRKAMVMFNEIVFQGMSDSVKLDPSKVGIEIPVVTQEQWNRIRDVFLPACMAGKISDEYFLSQIPGMDVEEEKKRAEERAAKALEDFKRQVAEEQANQNMQNISGSQGQQFPNQNQGGR